MRSVVPVLCLLAVLVGFRAMAQGPVEDKADRDRVTAEVKKLNGVISSDAKLPGKPITIVRLKNKPATDDLLSCFDGLGYLRVLELDGTKISDAGLANLKGLKQLAHLQLEGTAITDAGLAHLTDLKSLQFLGLSKTRVTDAGLAHLKGLTELRILNLQKTAATPDGIKSLKKSLPKVLIFN